MPSFNVVHGLTLLRIQRALQPESTVPDDFLTLSCTAQLAAIRKSLPKDLAEHELLQSAEQLHRKALGHFNRIELFNNMLHVPLPSVPISPAVWIVKEVRLALTSVGLPQRAKMDFTWFVSGEHHKTCAMHKFRNEEDSCAVAVVANLCILLNINALEIDQFPIAFHNQALEHHTAEGRAYNPFHWLARVGVQDDDDQTIARLESLKHMAHEGTIEQINQRYDRTKSSHFKKGDYIPFDAVFNWATTDIPQITFPTMEIFLCHTCQDWSSRTGDKESPAANDVCIQNHVNLQSELNDSINRLEAKNNVEAWIPTYFGPRVIDPQACPFPPICHKCKHSLQSLVVVGGDPPARLFVDPWVNPFIPGNCTFEDVDITFHQLHDDGAVTQRPTPTRYRVRAIIKYVNFHFILFWRISADTFVEFDSMKKKSVSASMKTLQQIVKEAQAQMGDKKRLRLPRETGSTMKMGSVDVAYIVYERSDCFPLLDSRF